MPLKDSIKRINETACNDGGWFHGACSEVLNGNKNYALMICFALLVQYVFPVVLLVLVFMMLTGNIMSISIIEVLRFFNPFFVVLYIPVAIANSIMLAIILVAVTVGSIMYWMYYFKNCVGPFVLVPVGAWLLAIVAWPIPVAGPFISIIISAFPWLPFMLIVHWWAYS